MNKILFLAIILLFSNTYAQQKVDISSIVVFGKVNIEDLKKSVYEIDSTADAIVLYEKNKVDFGFDNNLGFYIDSKIHVRKKNT